MMCPERQKGQQSFLQDEANEKPQFGQLTQGEFYLKMRERPDSNGLGLHVGQ